MSAKVKRPKNREAIEWLLRSYADNYHDAEISLTDDDQEDAHQSFLRLVELYEDLRKENDTLKRKLRKGD